MLSFTMSHEVSPFVSGISFLCFVSMLVSTLFILIRLKNEEKRDCVYF